MTTASRGRLSNPETLLSILDNLPTSIFVKDEQLRFVYSNNAHCAMVGKSEEELLGRSDADFYQPEEAAQYLKNDRSVLETGEVNTTEERVARLDGQTSMTLTRKARLVGPNGETLLIGTNSDLSEIKEREKQLRALTETVPVAVAQIALDGTMTSCNPLFSGLMDTGDKTSSNKVLVASLTRQWPDFPGSACRFEADLMTPTGQKRVLAMSSGWLGSETGNPSAIICIVDVSENRELLRINEEIRRLNVELSENMKKLADAQAEIVKKGKLEQLGQLTATIAHELRNPLGSVRTNSFLVKRRADGKSWGIDTQLERIEKGILRCDAIITQLLDFSRSNRVECKGADLDAWLETVLTEEVRQLDPSMEVICDLGMSSLMVPFDGARLRRALINLISNAAEAMIDDQSKAGTPQIRISTGVEQGMAFIKVSDNGPGMSPEILCKVREPLFTTKNFGTGLGVPAVEQIALQHGGSLDISSTPGVGSVFTLFLPLQRAEAA